MVSNARLDLPEPDSPVTTTSRSRGISSEMFLRLWTRAPCTATVVRAATRGAFPPTRFAAALEAIRWPPCVEEREFLHADVALLRQLHGRGRLADQSPVGQVFARSGHAAHVEVAPEVVLDLGARAGLADFA